MNYIDRLKYANPSSLATIFRKNDSFFDLELFSSIYYSNKTNNSID